jgi:hypothetical protein
MIDQPQITQAAAQPAAVIHFTIPPALARAHATPNSSCI